MAPHTSAQPAGRVVKGRTKRLHWLLGLTAVLVGAGWWRFAGSLCRDAAGPRPHSASPLLPPRREPTLAFSLAQISRLHITLMNVLWAEGLPGAESLNAQECFAQLGQWTEHVRTETERHLYRFKANPREERGHQLIRSYGD
jgi:hypothetical protein